MIVKLEKRLRWPWLMAGYLFDSHKLTITVNEIVVLHCCKCLDHKIYRDWKLRGPMIKTFAVYTVDSLEKLRVFFKRGLACLVDDESVPLSIY